MGNSGKKHTKPYEPGTLAAFAVIGMLLIALGVVTLLSVIGGLQGTLFTQVKQVMQGLGGSLCIGISVLLIWAGVLVAFSSGRSMPKRGILLITLLYFAVLALFNLLSRIGQYGFMDYTVYYSNTSIVPPPADAAGFGNLMATGYELCSRSGEFGGALGMLLAWPCWTFLGTTISVVILSILCLVCILLFSRFDFLQVFESVRAGAEERRQQKEARRQQLQYQQMLQEQQVDENDLQRPAFLRRNKREQAADAAQPVQVQPVQPAPPGYPPYGSMLQGQVPYAPMMNQPVYPQAMPVAQPQQNQPELYNEIIMPQDKQPTWRRSSKKAAKEKEAANAYQTKMTFTPSEMGVPIEPSPSEQKLETGDAVILSPSRRKALERIEEIRKRKAEISAEIQGNDQLRNGEEDYVLPPIEPVQAQPVAPVAAQMAQPVQAVSPTASTAAAAMPVFPPIVPVPASAAAASAVPTASAYTDSQAAAAVRTQAYKRPVPLEQQRGTVAPNAASSMDRANGANAANPAAELSGAAPKPGLPYVYPTIELLNLQQRKVADTRDIDRENATRLEKTLESFGIPARVQRVTHGPAVTRFELGLVSSGINVKRIMSIADNIALDLAANGGVRIEIPIPGTNLFGIEVPNKEIQSVSLAEVLLSPEMKAAKSPLAVALGRDIAGKPIICDLAKMPHLLIAGQTGSGKSVCINTIINSLLYRSSPEEVRMIMVDPKVVELQCYNVVPHLLIPVVSDPHKAAGALAWAVAEMLDRYHKMQSKNVRELNAYNAKLGPGEEKLPRIVIIIDELADLMLACKKDVEESIIRLAQLARAAGIHMVVATQRPTVDVITGLIKANIPSRIAFAVSSSIDSRTILDQNGAEKLLGKGDMFYAPTGANAPLRVQGCFLSDSEIERVVGFIEEHSKVEFDPNVLEALDSEEEAVNPLDDGGEDSGVDDRLAEAIEMVISDGQASISMLQRRMKIGYARAGRLIDDMAARGIVSKSVGSKPREVLMTREEFDRIRETLR